jgi:hypothetical protein
MNPNTFESPRGRRLEAPAGIGAICEQASQGTMPRHPAMAGRKPNRKMAFFSEWSWINIAFAYHKRLERLLGTDT